MKPKADDRSVQSNPTMLIADVKKIIEQARAQAYSAVNSAMVQAYWLIGRRIVEEEQGGEKRAEYGACVIASLSRELAGEFGRGFSIQSLKNFRQFYLTFPDLPIGSTVWSQSEPKSSAAWSRLSWSHFKVIMRVPEPAARAWYVEESAANNWPVRALDRNVATQYYQRLLASQVKEPVVREMEGNAAPLQNDKLAFIKNPTVLEFLNLPMEASLTESKIEAAIIDNLRHFLLELGKGFAFVDRQKLIRTEVRDYFIDLVFYNYILKCFVLIDLKTERITHQDVGQMDMYVRMYDETIKGADDNPTVGIVLCSETDRDIARYSILKGNEQIFATKYKLYLPSEQELAEEIAREKELIRLQLEREDA
jgi:predicted nuclease of restriction endonuclease-like (RecB) superfamily